MTAGAGRAPLRVEQALRLLPDVDALAPLRAFLISSSRPRQADTWATAEHYSTVGKRLVQPADLRARLPQATARVAEHLTALYGAAVDALESEQRGDLSGAVEHLLRAGQLEEAVGRYAQAHGWYNHAFGVAEELRDRHPEIAALRHVGQLERVRGHLDEGARALQRSLVLAEAEMDSAGAALACLGLGEVALAQNQLGGADSWFTRGLRHSESDRLLDARLTLHLAEVARQRGEVGLATDRLARARAWFEELGDLAGAVEALKAQGMLAAADGRVADAMVAYREALQRLQRGGGPAALEMLVRLSLCELHYETGRVPDAEAEMRRAEELAIAQNFPRQLARLYVIMGKMRGREHDENGFIFFEMALRLCSGLEPAPRQEAEVYVEYGRFRIELGDKEEGRGYLERAREILELLGDTHGFKEVQADLATLTP